MRRLFAIGGGEISTEDTRAIDEAVLAAAETDDPRVLFFPTASEDSTGYVETFRSYYGESLGCETDVASIAGNATDDALAEKVRRADVVYVGGGHTGYLLDTLRTRNVDALLREAWRDGTVMAGLSAGAVCWFAGGVTDRPGVESTPVAPVHGLGFVSGLHATVHATPERRSSFARYLSVRDATGVALENDAAIEVRDDEWRVHTSSANGFAFHVGGDGDALDVRPLPADDRYRPLDDLR